MDRKRKRPLKPVYPGEILREDYLAPLGLSMNQLALDLRVPVTRISEIAHGRRAISADTALRLGRYFKTTPEFWLNLQTFYDLELQKTSFCRGLSLRWDGGALEFLAKSN